MRKRAFRILLWLSSCDKSAWATNHGRGIEIMAGMGREERLKGVGISYMVRGSGD